MRVSSFRRAEVGKGRSPRGNGRLARPEKALGLVNMALELPVRQAMMARDFWDVLEAPAALPCEAGRGGGLRLGLPDSDRGRLGGRALGEF